MNTHLLSPDTAWFVAPRVASDAYRDYTGRVGTLRDRPSRRGAVSRLLRGLAAQAAALRERRAVVDQLSTMSDRDLADIGLSRAQIHAVFDPEFVQARDAPHRAADDLEEQALAELGLSRTLPRLAVSSSPLKSVTAA